MNVCRFGNLLVDPVLESSSLEWVLHLAKDVEIIKQKPSSLTM